MFKRLHATGGVAYVIGGIGALATVPAVALFTLGALGVSVPSSLLMYSVIVFIIGAMVAAVVFNTGTMQVVAQNRTTAAVERLGEQLADANQRGGRFDGRRRSVGR